MTMKSVASVLRERAADEVRRMSSAERLELAFRLGEQDIAAYCAAHGVDRADALREFQRRRQATRQPSGCMERIIE